MKKPGLNQLVMNMFEDKSDNPFTPIRKIIKNSGIYALSTAVSPLISLILAPLLTHNLSPTDYGILTILNLCISLGAGISQLGLPAAFFRTYGYDYDSSDDRRDVLATATTLLCVVSLLLVLGITLLSSFLAQVLLGHSILGNLVIAAGIVLLLQNLTVPGLTWLRAENRAFAYSLLSIGNLFVTSLGNIILVLVLHLGIVGSLMANGCGYAIIGIYTIPIILFRAGIKIRIDIARNLLSFGLPLAFNFVSYWILQLSDRYLLRLFDSFAKTAIYSIAYTMGTAINFLIIGPFALAWSTSMFIIAKREDATQVFKIVFRWFSLLLLFSSFCLSLIGKYMIHRFFPAAYHSAEFIVPIISVSSVFFGVYYVFMVGADIKRKNYLTVTFTTVSAIVNIGFNLTLIPHYGIMGAALSTLFAYIVLALIAYIVNQKIYFIPFEISLFSVALVLGAIFYVVSDLLVQRVETNFAWPIDLTTLCLYGVCLALLIKLSIFSCKDRF